MKHEYVVLGRDRHPDHCVLSKLPEEFPALHRPAWAMPMGDRYKEPFEIPMSRRYGGKKLANVIRNTFGYLIVDGTVRELLAKEVPADEVEFLPIHIVDHKGKRLKEPFYIANLLATADCADLEKSEYVQDPMHKEVFFQYLSKLALVPAKVPKDKRIFRLKPMPEVHILRSDFAEELLAARLTGIRMMRLSENLGM